MHTRRTSTTISLTTVCRRRARRTVAMVATCGLLVALTVLVPAVAGPVAPAAADNVLTAQTSIAVGGGQSCALTAGGAVKCWGRNDSGQLGNNSTTDSSVPVDVSGLGSGVTAVAAGAFHTCALTAGGAVKCWGYNDFGQLGNNSTASSSVPVDVSGLGSGVTAIAAGLLHSCAVTAGGAVKCWGRNDTGQLGNGSTASSSVPVDVSGLGSGVTAIAAGNDHSCAVAPGGAVKCWGNNDSGQLGSNSTNGSKVPVDVSGLGSGVTAIAAGSYHSCALTAGGAARCWGYNFNGQLGNNSTTNSLVPSDVFGSSSGIAAIATGTNYSCALTAGGAARCWGQNSFGQLGNNSTTNSSVPVDVAGGSVFGPAPPPAPALSVVKSATESSVEIGATIHYQVKVTNTGNVALNAVALEDPDADCEEVPSAPLAVGADVSVACTHASVAGDVGTYANTATATSTEVTTPVASNQVDVTVTAPPNVLTAQTSIAAGADHSCALTAGGAVKCWGNNAFGQLGNNSTTRSSVPAAVSGLGSGVTAIAAGTYHSCALTAGGAVKCWGRNSNGQLGNNSTTYSEPPVDVSGLGSGVTAIAAGTDHSCASTAGGAVKCWGYNGNGQLGNGTLSNSSVPVGVSGLGSGVIAIAVGGLHTCGLTSGGAVQCWGFSGFGQLGNDSTTQSRVPVGVSGLGSGVTAVAAGDNHSCGLTAGGAIKCWGLNGNGQLGNNSTTNSSVPVDVAGGPLFGPPAPALTVVKSATESSVVAGATIHYQVKVTNTGNVPLNAVAVEDPGADCDEVPSAPLAVGADVSVACTHVSDAVDVGTYSNTATATSTEVTTPVASNQVDVTVTVAAPGLSVALSADEVSVSPGQVAHFHVVVSNTGNVGLHNVTVTDTMVPDCADDGVFDLAVGDFVTIDCERTMTGNDAGTFEHKASVTSDEVSTPVVSNQVDVTVHDAFTVVMTADRSTVAVGSPVVFTIKVKNTSSLVLMTPTVVDEAVPDCVSAPVGAQMQPGQEHTVTCTFVPTVDDIGIFSNTATADSSQIVAVTSNQVDVTVEAAAPAMTLTQTADQSEVVAGEPIDVNLVVTNTGNTALHDVTVSDPSAPGCQRAPFVLAAGAVREIFCTHVSTGADVPVYTNPVTATATELSAPVGAAPLSVTVTIPAGDAHVAGTVTEQGSGDPIAGAVAALLSPVDFSPVAIGTADAAGHFSALAAPGSYYVYVLDPGGDHAAAFHGAPTLVAASADSTAAADTALVSTRGTISGVVTADGTGDPLGGVMAINVDLDSGVPGAGDLTDADGAYAITGLRPGPKLVEFVDLSGGHRPEFFDDQPTTAGSSVVSVVGASQATANAGLAAQTVPAGGAHLVGQVTSITGGPLEGAAVMAVHTADFSLAAGVLTDSAGNYDLGLDAGTYKVAFYDSSGAHGFEWFDDQGPNGLVDAATVTATAGTPTTVDTALTPTTGTASGTVTETGTGVLLADVGVFAIDATGTTVAATTTAADGTYTLAGLPPGDHRVRFVDLTGAHTSEYHLDAPDYDGATLVPATAGGATGGIDAALTLTG